MYKKIDIEGKKIIVTDEESCLSFKPTWRRGDIDICRWVSGEDSVTFFKRDESVNATESDLAWAGRIISRMIWNESGGQETLRNICKRIKPLVIKEWTKNF